MTRITTNRTATVALCVTTVPVLLLAVYFAVGPDEGFLRDFANKWLYNAVILAAGLICVARAAWGDGERLAWLLFGVAVLLWCIGDTYYVFVLMDLESPPYPSFADVFWLAVYPPSYVALVLLLRARLAGFRASLWLDGLIGALAAAALGTAVVFDAVLDATGGANPMAVATNLAYPLADLLLIGLVVGGLALTGWRAERAWGMIAAGLVVFSASDSLYLYQTAVGSYVAGTLTDLGWLAGLVLIAWAAWQPRGSAASVRPEGWWVFMPPVLFAFIAVGVLVYDHFVRVNLLALILAASALVAVIVRLALTFAENMRMLSSSRREARTDALTGLGNRRKLMGDLGERLEWDGDARDRALVLFDLNGFKHYNDTYGHPAGDALLVRLGRSLASYVDGRGSAYRMGGDEFCVLFRPQGESAERLAEGAALALSEQGEGFSVTAAYGSILVPREATTSSEALRIADQRLYAHKSVLRGSPSQQLRNALMQALSERHPEIGAHLDEVAEFAEAVARKLGIEGEEARRVRMAAALHDIGKMAVPDAILNKAGPLDEEEWTFIRRHTLIGERILHAAASLADVATLVRSSHERFDGGGYPDGLRGTDIPLGARIIFVCDAFDAITSGRPYRPARTSEEAIEELRRCAGTQFDPTVVEAFCLVVAERSALPVAS